MLRHDNDRKLPRTTKEIYELNRAVARKMETVFSSKDIPVIPSIGASSDLVPPTKNTEFTDLSSRTYLYRKTEL